MIIIVLFGNRLICHDFRDRFIFGRKMHNLKMELGCDISHMWKEAKFIDTEDITYNSSQSYNALTFSASQLLCNNSVNMCELGLCPSNPSTLKKSNAP